MSSKIRVLDDALINQIAAGEVVENAASVVKELVENAVDAGATEVGVWIKAGGRQLIRVADDGCGMSRDDALLCLERHATSKIREATDLVSVGTLGFRGEAVAAIAAVSRLSLLTSEGEEGTQVVVDGGKIRRCTPAARSRGTTLEVQALFHNVPARREFQKSTAHDTGEVRRVMTSLALANPAVRFALDDVLIAGQTSGEPLHQLGQRIGQVLGEELLGSCKPVATEQVIGYVSDPSLNRPNRRGQHLFINGRAVVSRQISDMVRSAFATRLPEGRHPVYVLHLELPGDWVDVNVHPQKREVRLQHDEKIEQLIHGAIGKALAPPKVEVKFEPLRACEPRVPFGVPFVVPSAAPVVVEQEPELVEAPIEVLALYDRYILFDAGEEGLALVDVPAAKRRVIYEELLAKKGTPDTQLLLVPVTLDLDSEEERLLEEKGEELEGLGFSIRPFGPHTAMVDGLPAIVASSSAEELIREVLAGGEPALAAAEGASKGAKVASIVEARALVQRLMRCEIPMQCPKGRPTVTHLKQEELRRRFR